MKKIISILIIIITVLSGVFAFNYFSVTKPMSEVLEEDPRNSGIEIYTHYNYFINPSVLVVDVRDISGEKAPADVFRVLLQYASKLKDTPFDKVLLQSKGKTKFILEGVYFELLGEEYGIQNPVYTMRTFPENVYTPDGEKAFSTWSGGFLGVMKEQMEDFADFHHRWYIEDI